MHAHHTPTPAAGPGRSTLSAPDHRILGDLDDNGVVGLRLSRLGLATALGPAGFTLPGIAAPGAAAGAGAALRAAGDPLAQRLLRASGLWVAAALLVGGALAGRPALAAGPAAPTSPLGAWAHGLVIGGAAGSSDYGNAFKGQLTTAERGRSMPQVPGLWRFEAQVQSMGSQTYQQFGNTYQREAWSAGASALPLLPVAPQVTAYGKLGAHYLSSRASGPGLDTRRSGLRGGVGAGVRWQALPGAGLRLEYETIGGAAGGVASLGLEIPL
ncbi:MAG: hypothetical protein RL722_2406 [Pseudomonadota bacterium]|jgi:hypothetical protein